MMRRAFLVLLLICLGCSAQSPPADVAQLVERHVRAQYSLPPGVKVILGPLRASDFANYDALTVTFASPNKKQEFEFLLSRDHKTLVRLTKMDLTSDPYAEIMKKIDVSGRPTRGNRDAKVTVVNYDDFECPFCSRMHETLFPGLFKEYGNQVLFIYKDYPLEEIHPWAVHAAVNANCLGAQNGDAYWDYADYLHGNQHAISAEKGRDGQNAELDKLAAALKDLETRIPKDLNWVLRIDGHTDIRPISTGNFRSNWELSSSRAISVVKFLISKGVSPGRLVAAGFGEYQPLSSGGSDGDLRRNRRIELKLTEK